MSDFQRESEFLRQCLLYGDTEEHLKLEESIVRLQRNERCVLRAVWLMALLAVLATVGLVYSIIFQADQLEIISQLATPLSNQVFCILGLGALICLVWFVGLGLANRRELDQRREECRRWTAKFLESRLGKPITTLPEVPNYRHCEEHDGAAHIAQAGNRPPAASESAARA